MRLPKKFAQKSRKVFYFIHLWTGLILGLWLVMMGLTGSVLAWRSELTGMEARYRVGAVKPGRNDKIIPVSKAIAALKAADPELTPERGIYLPPGEYGYYLINARKEINGKRASLIYMVDPVTAKVYPPVDRSTLWVQTFEGLHDDLLLEARGLVANGIFSFFTFFMLISGAWLWWPSNWKQFKQRIAVKRGLSIRRTLYDLHNVFGVYLFIILFVLTMTGVLMVVNSQTDRGINRAVDRWAGIKEEPRSGRGFGEGRGGGRGEGRPNARARGREGANGRVARGGRAPSNSATVSGGTMPDVEVTGPQLPVDVLVDKARAALPNNTLLFVSLPRRPGQPFQTSFDPISFNNGLVLFNPYTGERLEANGRTFSPGYIVTKTIGDLHYGWYGGKWTKFFYALTGFMPLGLFITGVWMWINKKRGRGKNQKRRAGGEALKAKIASTESVPAGDTPVASNG